VHRLFSSRSLRCANNHHVAVPSSSNGQEIRPLETQASLRESSRSATSPKKEVTNHALGRGGTAVSNV